MNFTAGKLFSKSFFVVSIFCTCTLFAAPPQLRVNGTKFQTVDGGCEVRLAGVNICGNEWSANSYGPPSGFGGDLVKSVNSAVIDWKSNCLRIPLNQDFWFGYSDGNSKSSSTANETNKNKYRKFIDDAVAAASEKNAYVELDLHWSGNGSWGSSITAKQQNMPDDNSTEFWKDMAARYRNNPAVIFNLYNEPKDDTWAIWKNGGQSKSGFHTPGFQALVTTIREAGANNVIIVGGLAWAYDMTGVAANALRDTDSGNGIAYEAHIYDNKGAGAPGIWDTNVSVAVKAGYCVVIGEFGPKTDGTQDKSGCTPFEDNLIAWIDGKNSETYSYSALGWSFNTDAPPKMIASWNFEPTGCHGTKVKEWLASVQQPECTPTAVAQPISKIRVASKRSENTVHFDMFGRRVNGAAPGARGNGVFIVGNGTSVRRVVALR